jgi:osmotically-inducible protein OsmY
MITETTFAESVSLEQTLERRITERTWGRIRRLQVEVAEGRVLIRGFTESYYAKQLAIQGALDVLGPGRARELVLQIEVGSSAP